MVQGAGHHRLLAGQCGRRRHRGLCRRQRANSRSRPSIRCASSWKREGRFNAALSDFIAPVSSGVPDYIGAFVVTAGIGEDVIADRFKRANDDYSSILCKALADRLAEAFAERMHARVRREFWGYAPDETLAGGTDRSNNMPGIRPAPGYPAQPDHTEKATLFRLLDAENTAGVKLTESYAMWPGSSVSGLYFSHPESFISASARSSATRSRTTPRARAGASPRPNAGWRPFSITRRSPRPASWRRNFPPPRSGGEGR
jgi:hypothetical protein